MSANSIASDNYLVLSTIIWKWQEQKKKTFHFWEMVVISEISVQNPSQQEFSFYRRETKCRNTDKSNVVST